MVTAKPSEIVLRIHRPWTEQFEDVEGRTRFHHERAKMLHGLVDALGVEVKDWGETDAPYPREVVEVVVAVASAAVAAAVAEVIKAWLERRRAREVELVRPNGTTISVRGMSQEELSQLGAILWRKPRRRGGKP
jgi:hypothetical protein